MSNMGNLVMGISPGDQLRIGDDVVIGVEAYRWGGEPKLRIKISAPKDVPVHRVRRDEERPAKRAA
jgi:sRNA-binding carbon storage regulator CsrA